MSVPTTLQGTHDGCGGTVVFRPAMHRRELMAGHTVQLSAACQTCGATLTTPWRLPDVAVDAWQQDAAGHGHAHAQAQQELPMAAGAENWRSQPAPSRPAERPAVAPVAQLGDWRMRDAPMTATAMPERERAAATSDDPAMQAFLSQFSSKVETARQHLRQASTDLPSAMEEGGFRTPNLTRRPDLGSSSLSPTPSGFRAVEPQPTAAESPVVADDAATALATAIASPSFMDDQVAPVVESMPVAAPAMPDPILAEPVAVAAVVEEPVVAEPVAMESAYAEPVVEALPLAASAPSAAVAAPAVVAPTDDDVFPPAPAPEAVPVAHAAPFAPAAPLVAGAPMTFEAPPAPATVDAPAPAGDAAAGVWAELPITATAPAPAVAPTFAAPPAVQPTAPAPTFEASPFEAAPSFADAFGEAADAVAQPAQPATSPHAAGAAMPQAPTADEATFAPVDASVAFEQDRGFDWGSENPAGTPKRGRRFGRRAAADTTAAAVSGPEVVFEPAPDADLATPRRRTLVGRLEIVLVVLLAAVAGLAATKVFTTDTAALRDASVTPTIPAAVTDGIVPPPATPAAGTKAVTAKTTKATTKKAPAAKARPKVAAPAGETIPKIATPGNVVGDAGATNPLADAATAAGSDAAAPSAAAQVPDTDADTAVVTASAAQSTSNPFARP